jgi:hypothetical protein
MAHGELGEARQPMRVMLLFKHHGKSHIWLQKARARDGLDICRHYTTRVVKAVERELEKVFNQASLHRRSADTLWSSARIGDVGKTKRGYMCLLPLTAKEEDVIAMISGGRTPFLLRRRKEDVKNKAVLQDEKEEGGVGCWMLSTYLARRVLTKGEVLKLPGREEQIYLY